LIASQTNAQPINRKALVERHTVINKTMDTLSSLSVGNGTFAFTVDATGLQSFPDTYAKGVPLGTESEWGWHSFPNTKGYTEEEFLKPYQLNGMSSKIRKYNGIARSKIKMPPITSVRICIVYN